MDPIKLIEELYYDALLFGSGPRAEIAPTILWNMMYHLDYQYSYSPRVPSFNQAWAMYKSDLFEE